MSAGLPSGGAARVGANLFSSRCERPPFIPSIRPRLCDPSSRGLSPRETVAPPTQQSTDSFNQESNPMKRRISRRFRPTMTPGLDQLESRQLLSSGFQVVTSVSGSTLNAVSAISPTDILAVGSGTLANGDKAP